jgi:hypothetical protein
VLVELVLNWLAERLTVYHAISLILIIFSIMVLFLAKEAIKVRMSLSRALDETTRILKDTKTVNLDTLDLLTESYSKSKLLRDPWEEYNETVIRDDSDEEILVYNTRPFSEFFSKESLEHSLHLSIFRKTPQILTSIGLLFTFLFIVFGLMHLHIQETGKVDGIKELVEGLSSKFLSSVFAIFFALVFTIIEGFCIRSVETKYQDLISTLDRKFSRKTSEDYLRTLDKSMRELSRSMRHFGTDLAGVIKEGLSEGMRPSTDRLLVAIENLERQKSENIADTLSKLLTEFKGSLTQSAGNEFASLATGVSKLAETMNQSAERSNLMNARIDGLLQSLDAQTKNQERVSEDSILKMQDGFGQLLKSIETTTNKQNENLSKILDEIVSRTSQATMGLISDVDALSKRNSNVIEGFSTLNASLSESIEKYKEALGSSQTLISTTSSVSASVNDNLRQLSEIQGKIAGTYNIFLNETSIVQQVQKQNAQSIENFRVVFREVETGLEIILRQLADNLQRYSDLTKNGLENYLKEYDSSLSTATTRLSSTVRDLDEVLENLSENLQVIRTTAPSIGA